MTRRVLVAVICLIGASSISGIAAAADVTLSAHGFAIDAGNLGKLTLTYPVLTDGSDRLVKQAGNAVVDAKVATITYANGAQLSVQADDKGYLLKFTNLPEDVKRMRMEMMLPIALKNGGRWAIDGGEPKAFPAEKGADPFLFKGNAKTFAVSGGGGGAFNVTIEHGYQQLQDNRHWNDTQSFQWMAATQLPRNNGNESYYRISFGTPGADSGGQPAATTTPVDVALGDSGVLIGVGPAGKFTLKYPTIAGLDPGKVTSVTSHSRDRTTLTYAGGASAEVTIVNGRDIQIKFLALPSSAKSMRMEMMVPFTMAQGGRYAIGAAQPQAFPAEKPASPFLYQGHGESMSLYHPTGPGFTVTLPQHAYQQLQDNREWNWTVFSWWFQCDLSQDNIAPQFTIKIGDLPGGPAKVTALVDRFGQRIDEDYPTKVRSEDELRQDAQADREYYGSLSPPQTDAFGGIPGTGEKYGLKKTGYFHLDKINGSDVLVTPEGNAFFQLGVCGLSPMDEHTLVAGRESIYAWLPPANDPTFKTAWRPNNPGVFSFHLANMIRKTGRPYDEAEYAAEWIERERKWGFNSAGAFVPTGQEPAGRMLREKHYPYVNFLPLGNLPEVKGAEKVWDPFADGIEATIDEKFAKGVTPFANDPLLIGRFIVNEPSVEDVPKVVPTLKASASGSKRRLVERLQEKYGDVAAFNAAWKLNVQSFEQAGEMPLAVTTREAADDVQAFFAEFLERRYSLVHTYFRKYDPNHLLIGDRWMPGTATNELMVRTAGKYLDIVSVNYYAYGIDRHFLDRIHRWSGGRPMILSEFYYTSPKESGLHGGRSVETQTLRGLAYRNYVEQAAALGYVVGIQWFLNMDQSCTGRFFQQFNGEAANTGLVDVADRPYKDFLAEVMKTNYDIFSVIAKQREPFQLDDPRFTFKGGGAKKTVTVSRMVKPFVLDASRGEWPQTPPYRIEPRGKDDFEASFRVAWDNANLYLYVEVTDHTPMNNTHRGPSIWNGDAIELFVGTDKPDAGGTMIFSDRQVLIRGAQPDGQEAVYFINAPQQYATRSIVVPQVDGKGYVVEVAIPFEALGFTPKMNQELLFDLAIDDSTGKGGRSRQLLFNGTEQASKDRGVWGRAQLVN